MKILTKIIALLLILSSLSSCQNFKAYHEAELDLAKDNEIAVAKYNNKYVTLEDAKIELNKFIIQHPSLKGLEFNKLDNDQKKLIIKEVIANKVLVEKAISQKLNDEEFNKAVRIFKETLLKEKLLNEITKEVKNEEFIKKKYDELAAKLKTKQDIRIKYIALANKREADDLFKILIKSPQKFSYYAKKKSLDKETAKKGGDLGYVLRDQLPQAIAKYSKNMKKYQISKPIKSNDSWIIFKLYGQRPAKIANFEDVKNNLASQLAKEKIQEFSEDLIDDNKVKYLLD